MCKSEVKVLLVGDVGSGKSKFIEKVLLHYPESSRFRHKAFEEYVCNVKGHVIYLYNLNDATECRFFYKVDVILLSYSSDDPETFRSLQEKWIPNLLRIEVEHPLVMDNVSIKHSLTEEQSTSVSNEQVEAFANLFGLLWCTAYYSEYKEVLSILKNILEDKSTENKPDSDECMHDALSKNEHNSNELSTVELRSNECSTVELRSNKYFSKELRPKDDASEESVPNDRFTEKYIPNHRFTKKSIPNHSFTEESIPNHRFTEESNPNNHFTEESSVKGYVTEEPIPSDYSTAPMSPSEYVTVESIPSDCSTVPLSPKGYKTEESISSDCSTIKLSPKKRVPVEFSPYKFSTPVNNPDKFERNLGKYSPEEFSADECTPDHSTPDSLDAVSPIKSSPDGVFSSDYSSSDEDRTTLTPTICSSNKSTLAFLSAYSRNKSRAE